jgi:hypothetical protein
MNEYQRRTNYWHQQYLADTIAAVLMAIALLLILFL